MDGAAKYKARRTIALDNLRKEYRRVSPESVLATVWALSKDQERRAELVQFLLRFMGRNSLVLDRDRPKESFANSLNFVLARVVRYAARFSHRRQPPVTWSGFLGLASATLRFYSTYVEPVGHEREATDGYHASKPWFVFSRILFDQNIHNRGRRGYTARLAYLWEDAVQAAQQRDGANELGFDFDTAFHAAWDVGFDDYRRGALALVWGAYSESEFTRSLTSARENAPIPSDAAILSILDRLSVPLSQYDQFVREPPPNDVRFMRPQDSKFDGYAFDLSYFKPILRLACSTPTLPELDRLMVPIPRSLHRQVSDAIYWELRRASPAFTNWFGAVFEEAVGIILRESLPDGVVLVSEAELWRGGYSSCKKTPDWVIVEPDGTLVLVECKAATYPERMALADRDRPFEIHALRPAAESAAKFAEFEAELRAGAPGLERFRRDSEVLGAVVTYGNFPMSNSQGWRDGLRSAGVDLMHAVVLSLEELETVQHVLQAGIPFSDLIGDLHEQDISGAVDKYREKAPFRGSWLANLERTVLVDVFPDGDWQ